MSPKLNFYRMLVGRGLWFAVAWWGLSVAWAQNSQPIMVVNKGDTVSIKNEYIVSIKGGVWNKPKGFWYNACDSVLVTDTVRNSGGNTMFGTVFPNGQPISKRGAVILRGGLQNIDGPDVITFQTLRLRGANKKTMDNDAIVQDTLDLDFHELDTRTHTLFVTSTSTQAILRTDGFVSSDSLNPGPGGALSRAMKSTGTYLFPVGDSLTTLRYRPIEFTPSTADSAVYTVRFANYRANFDGFPIENKDDTLCLVNPFYFWRINRTHGQAPAALTAYYDPATDTVYQYLGHYQTEWELIGGQTQVGTPLSSVTVPGWNLYQTDAFAFVRVDPTVRFDPILDSLVCSNSGFITITGLTPPGGTLYVDGIEIPGTSFPPGQFGPGIHVVKYVYGDSLGCTNAWVDTFRVYDPEYAFVSIAQGDTVFCQGESVTLQANPFGPDYQVEWFFNGVSLGNTQTVTLTTPGSVILIVNNLVTGCSDTLNTPIAITVNPVPVTTLLNPPTNICSNDPPFFWVPQSLPVSTSTTTYTYYYNGVLQTSGLFNPAVFAQNGQPESVTVTLITTRTYTVPKVSFCTDTLTTTIVVNPPPVAQIQFLTNPDGGCGAAILKALPDNMLYEWSNGQTTQIITVTVSTVLTVKVTDPATGCSDFADQPVQVKVYAVPNASLVTAPPAAVCNDALAFQLKATTDFGLGRYYLRKKGQTNYVEQPDNWFVPQTYAQNGFPDTVEILYVARLVYPDVPLTCTDTLALQIIVNPRPDAGIEIVSGTNPLCADGKLVLSALPAGPQYTYLWSTGETTPSISVNTSQVVTLTVTGPGGCSDVIDTPLKVEVQPVPEVALTLTPAVGPYCTDKPVTIGTVFRLGYSYAWQRLSASGLENLPFGTAEIETTESGTYIVTVTDNTTSLRCTAQAQISVAFEPAPTVELVLEGTPAFCDGQSVRLRAEPPGLTYRWFRDGIQLADADSTSRFYTVTESGVYAVQVRNAVCPNVVASNAIPLNLLEYAPVRAAGLAQPDTVTPTQAIAFTDRSVSDALNGDTLVSWLWDFADGSPVSTERNPTHAYTEQGPFNVVLTAISQNGCRDTTLVPVYVLPEIVLMPNAFSPNNDGINDLYVPYLRGVQSFSLKIFDRWGGLVFSTTDPLVHWNGTNTQNQALPEGVYVYTVEAQSITGDLRIKKSGSITLVR